MKVECQNITIMVDTCSRGDYFFVLLDICNEFIMNLYYLYEFYIIVIF